MNLLGQHDAAPLFQYVYDDSTLDWCGKHLGWLPDLATMIVFYVSTFCHAPLSLWRAKYPLGWLDDLLGLPCCTVGPLVSMSDILVLPFSVSHPVLMHKVYVTLGMFGHIFRKPLAVLGLTCNTRGSQMKVVRPSTQLMSALTCFWKFNTSSTEVIWGWGLMCPCLTLKSTLCIWMGREKAATGC